MKQFPKSRKEKLVVRGFKDEILIYDKVRHKAHCLNGTAALVWKLCDGRTSVAEIGRRLSDELEGEGAADERLVWYALKQFNRDHLLEERLDFPADFVASMNGGFNRRQMIRALGLTAVVALPLVTSMVAPTPAQAATCFHANSPCTTNVQCCSGSCVSNACVGG